VPATARSGGSAILSDTAAGALPREVLRLFDGERLPEKVGHTAMLVAVDDEGWPRVALLSVGEVLATTGGGLALLTNSSSRTTAALQQSGRAMLLTVIEGTVHKLMLRARAVGAPPHSSTGFVAFRAEVDACESDHAPYATVVHGIEFELTDEVPVLERWQQQIGALRVVGGGA
jgi:hypothetical protein